jgi:hypothetical protein
MIRNNNNNDNETTTTTTNHNNNNKITSTITTTKGRQQQQTKQKHRFNYATPNLANDILQHQIHHKYDIDDKVNNKEMPMPNNKSTTAIHIQSVSNN